MKRVTSSQDVQYIIELQFITRREKPSRVIDWLPGWGVGGVGRLPWRRPRTPSSPSAPRQLSIDPGDLELQLTRAPGGRAATFAALNYTLLQRIFERTNSGLRFLNCQPLRLDNYDLSGHALGSTKERYFLNLKRIYSNNTYR